MLKQYKDKLFCFSPAVMLATFFIEIGLILITVWRYKLNTVGRLAISLLLFLAIFQAAEYNVCEGGWVDPMLASRIGYVAITMLPPLGIHMAYALAGATRRPLLMPAYVSAVMFGVFFAIVGQSLSGHACLGNYVIFQMLPGSHIFYTLYYYGWLLATLWLCVRLARGKAVRIRKALYGFAVGELAFIVPTTIATIVDPSTLAGIPSIMCGFAVLLALTLVCWVLPYAGLKR